MKRVYIVYESFESTMAVFGECPSSQRVLKIFEDQEEAIKYIYEWYFANKHSTEHMTLDLEYTKILTRHDGSPEARIVKIDDDEGEYFMTDVFYVPGFLE